MITFLIRSYCTKRPTSRMDRTVRIHPFSRLSHSSGQHYIVFLLKCSTFPLAVTESSHSHKLIQIQFQTRLQTSPSLINSHQDLFFLFREGNDSWYPMLIRNLLPIPGVRLWFKPTATLTFTSSPRCCFRCHATHAVSPVTRVKSHGNQSAQANGHKTVLHLLNIYALNTTA